MDAARSDSDDAPNAVLRGGPFDGERVHVTTSVPVVRLAGKVRHIYRRTANRDDEFPTLVVYHHEHTLVY